VECRFVYAFAARKLRRTRFALTVFPPAAPRVARQGEAWWAWQDSNLQPDRYERLKAVISRMKARIIVEF